jgi:hypothetical protein
MLATCGQKLSGNPPFLIWIMFDGFGCDGWLVDVRLVSTAPNGAAARPHIMVRSILIKPASAFRTYSGGTRGELLWQHSSLCRGQAGWPGIGIA